MTIRTFNKNKTINLMIQNCIGTKLWYKNGKRHRDNDLPAVEYPDGTKAWYQNGLLHRENDLPAYQHPIGTKEWFKNGKRYFPK